MPIWFEIIALMLVAYLAGLTIGWALWGRSVVVVETENPANPDTIKDKS